MIATEPQDGKANSRWWEYYAVRYAIGVGSGTPLVCLLWHHYHHFFEQATRLPIPFTSVVAAVLWAAAGLTYCYISSVPMLTFHVSRVSLTREFWGYKSIVVLALLLIVPSLAICFLCPHFLGCSYFVQCFALITLSALFAFQVFLIVNVLISPHGTEQLYDQLAKERPTNREFVESYRHMREHGNSVSIVLAELLLTFFLWVIHPSSKDATEATVMFYLVLVLVIWLAPSALVWCVGTRLEMHLTKSSSKGLLS